MTRDDFYNRARLVVLGAMGQCLGPIGQQERNAVRAAAEALCDLADSAGVQWEAPNLRPRSAAEAGRRREVENRLAKFSDDQGPHRSCS